MFDLKTGGEVRLGFPGARTQRLSLTDGRQCRPGQKDLAKRRGFMPPGGRLAAPAVGVRGHFPGSWQERLVPADEVYARPRDQALGARRKEKS